MCIQLYFHFINDRCEIVLNFNCNFYHFEKALPWPIAMQQTLPPQIVHWIPHESFQDTPLKRRISTNVRIQLCLVTPEWYLGLILARWLFPEKKFKLKHQVEKKNYKGKCQDRLAQAGALSVECARGLQRNHCVASYLDPEAAGKFPGIQNCLFNLASCPFSLLPHPRPIVV